MNKPPQRPNVLFILCDQLCASTLEAYNGTADTPNIGRLAKNGVLFEAAYCQTPLCSPSRASILTGQYPHRHGLVSNVMRADYPMVGGPETEEGIDRRDTTTEGILHANGWHTVHAGKWHVSGEKLSCYDSMYTENHEYADEMRGVFERVGNLPREQFMEWYGWKIPVAVSRGFAECHAKIPERWISNPRLNDYVTKFGRLDLPLEDTFDYRIASRGVEAIRTAKGPFMLTCSFNMPHDPNVAPSPYYENVDMSRIRADASLPCDAAYLNDLSKQVSLHAGDAFLTEFLRVYHAMLKLVDDQVGRLLGALEQRGILDNTVVIFTADHGDMAGGHGMFWKSTRSFYEEVARVPLIISAPGCKRGARYSKPVELVDLMPTVLDVCGLQTPGDIDGASLANVLSGGESTKDTALSERLHHTPGNTRHRRESDSNYNFMLRAGAYKYVVHRNGSEDLRLLFDLERDPNEYVNLCVRGGHEDKAAEMHALLRQRLSESGYVI